MLNLPPGSSRFAQKTLQPSTKESSPAAIKKTTATKNSFFARKQAEKTTVFARLGAVAKPDSMHSTNTLPEGKTKPTCASAVALPTVVKSKEPSVQETGVQLSTPSPNGSSDLDTPHSEGSFASSGIGSWDEELDCSADFGSQLFAAGNPLILWSTDSLIAFSAALLR